MPHHLIIFVLGVLSLLLFGCGATREALYLNPKFPEMGIEKITLAPVVDRRSDSTYEVNNVEHILDPAKSSLTEKGYQVMVAQNLTNSGTTVDLAEVAEMNDDELLPLIPHNTDALALVYLEDIRSEWGMRLIIPKYEFSVELTGIILSKHNGVIWRDQASSIRGGAGLIEAALVEGFAGGAIEDAIELLFTTVPAK